METFLRVLIIGGSIIALVGAYRLMLWFVGGYDEKEDGAAGASPPLDAGWRGVRRRSSGRQEDR